MSATIKRAVINALFEDDVDFADAVLSIVKPPHKRSASHPPRPSATATAAAAALEPAAAAPPPAEEKDRDTVSRKAVRSYMKRQLQRDPANFTAASVLPSGETCGAFLFAEWRARALKALNI